jgi:hypothetical protein
MWWRICLEKRGNVADYAAMSAENSPQQELNPADVAACAYMIWEKDGRPHGRDAEHWFQAETLLRAMRAAETGAAKEAAKAAPPTSKPAAIPRKRAAKRAAVSFQGDVTA